MKIQQIITIKDNIRSAVREGSSEPAVVDNFFIDDEETKLHSQSDDDYSEGNIQLKTEEIEETKKTEEGEEVASAIMDEEPSIAVLFNDSSNVFDYYKESGNIHADLEEYNNIKRIGEGSFFVEKDGINFYIDSKLFRFDFYRIEGIKRGKNYIALSTKGSDSMKIFVFVKGTDIIDTLSEKYSEYTG